MIFLVIRFNSSCLETRAQVILRNEPIFLDRLQYMSVVAYRMKVCIRYQSMVARGASAWGCGPGRTVQSDSPAAAHSLRSSDPPHDPRHSAPDEGLLTSSHRQTLSRYGGGFLR